MGTLRVGRLVASGVTLDTPASIRVEGNPRRRLIRFDGWMTQTTIADRRALRDELVDQVGQLVAFTWSGDASFDGYYIQDTASIDMDARGRPLASSGLYRVRFDLEHAGSVASTELQSGLTSALKENDHGIDSGEAVFWHAPSVGEVAYSGGGGVTAHERASVDGDIPVYLDLATTVSPKWGCAPSAYYDGAARVDINGYTRSGVNVPVNAPESFVLGNGLIELRGETSGGVSIGDLGIRAYDGAAWGSWTTFEVKYATTTAIPEWHYLTVIANRPEVVVIRLQRDADEDPPVDAVHTLDLLLRRGAPFVEAYYTYDHATDTPTWSVDRTATDAATAITPSGATQTMAVRDSADDGDGNRWVLGSSKTTTKDTTNGGIDFASTQTFDFFLGFEIGGSGANANDLAGALCLQYLGRSNEWVTAVRR